MDETTAEVTPTTTEPEATDPGGHPAWQELYAVVPPEPHLDNADLTAQQGFAKYEPWKPVIEANDPETVANALRFVQALNDDPARIHAAIAETYGLTANNPAGTAPVPPTPETTPVVPGTEDLDLDDPVQAKLAQALTQLHEQSQFIAQQRSTTEEQQAAQQLEGILAT